MNIMITRFGSSSQVDGINVFIWQLAEMFVQEGHTVDVVCSSGENLDSVCALFGIEPTNIRLFRVSGEDSGNIILRTLKWMTIGAAIINRLSPDAIIMNGAIPMVTKARRVLISHDLENRYTLQATYIKLIYRTFPIIITTTSELQEELISAYGFNKNRIRIIPTGINIKKYHQNPFDQRKNIILHIGTRKSKNLGATVSIFELIAKLDDDVELYIVGPSSEYLNETISQMGGSARSRTRYVGLLSGTDLRNLQSQVKLTIVPSSYAISVISPTVLESFASGTPVLGSSAISSDLLIDGYNGIKFRYFDESLARETVSLLNNQEKWEGLSNNALEHVRRFSISSISRKYLQLLSVIS